MKNFNDAYLQEHGYDPSVARDQVDVSTETLSVSKIQQARIWEPGKLGGNLTKLQDLLNYKRIQAELALLEYTQTAMPTKTDNKSPSISSLIGDWLERNQQHNILSNYISLLPNGSSSAGGIHLYHVICTAQTLPIIMRDITKLNILSRLLNLEVARCLVFTYRWHAEHAHTTANLLLGIHRSGGRVALNEQCPTFAGLVDHIFRFIEHEHSVATAHRRMTKRYKKADRPISTPDPKGLDMLPGDLYGLKPSEKPSSCISLRQRRYLTAYDQSWRTTEENRLTLLYKRSSLLLQEIWSYELVIPHLTVLDQNLNDSKRRRSTDLEDIRNRALTRGAILDSIARCLGTDAIFASERVLDFLINPALVYGERLRQDKDFARSVLKDPEATLEPLVTWLRECLSENSDVVQVSEDLRNFLLRRAMELSPSSKFPLDSSPDAPPNAERHIHKRKKLFSPITLQQLLLDNNTPKFMFIALILREAINERRGLPAAIETLNRVLLGQHATRAATQHNRDHTDPIRQYSGTASLLQEHLPGVKLTSREGLSNLLAWMGTGQGIKTKAFLRYTDVNGGFYSSTVGELVQKFEMILTHNTRLLAECGASSKKGVNSELVPGYIPLDDVRIWGQPSNQLSATPTLPGKPTHQKCTLEEKFSPYFSDVVRDSWMKWLGDLAGHDPAKYTGNLRSWKDGREFMAKLELKGFISGLTVFQLLNNLVFLGLASMPTVNDIADWIYENPTLGAYRGLTNLGFVLTDCGSVRCAFGCVYGHLEKHLTDDDKKLLGFSPIFVEHVLCKVVRWDKHLSDEMHPPSTLDAFAKEIPFHERNWVPGRNQVDGSAFPFPLEASMDDLDQIVKHISVRCKIL